MLAAVPASLFAEGNAVFLGVNGLGLSAAYERTLTGRFSLEAGATLSMVYVSLPTRLTLFSGSRQRTNFSNEPARPVPSAAGCGCANRLPAAALRRGCGCANHSSGGSLRFRIVALLPLIQEEEARWKLRCARPPALQPRKRVLRYPLPAPLQNTHRVNIGFDIDLGVFSCFVELQGAAGGGVQGGHIRAAHDEVPPVIPGEF